MRNRLTYFIAAGIIAAAAGPLASAADQAAAVPDELKPPAGNELYLKAQAVGTQNYLCMPTPSGMAWTFIGPQATLFNSFTLMGRELRIQVATHYLSPNSAENGTARATWQSSLDTSAVWARAIVTVNEANAIPWLLLQAVGTRAGVEGGTALSRTTYIQRLNTTGGVAPSTGCSAASDMGQRVFVPYTAEYSFYRAIL